MKIMLDINVLLDYFQKREPHFIFSSIVLSEVLKKKANGFVPAHAMTTIYYLIEKYADRKHANESKNWLLEHLKIAPADKSTFVNAGKLSIVDFEDAVVATLARAAKCDFIVTRNLPDFANSPVPAVTPEEFVRRFVSLENDEPKK